MLQPEDQIRKAGAAGRACLNVETRVVDGDGMTSRLERPARSFTAARTRSWSTSTIRRRLRGVPRRLVFTPAISGRLTRRDISQSWTGSRT